MVHKQKQVIGVHVDRPNWTFFGKLYFGT